MEEFVGEIWHKLITRRALNEHPSAQAALADLRPSLAIWYRALGGEPGKAIEGSDWRTFRPRRRLSQKLAGSHRRFLVAWQDDRSLRLPERFALFPERSLNEALYYWLTALAAEAGEIMHWFLDNQQATLGLLSRRPGLADDYQRLVRALLCQRPMLKDLEGAEREREAAIQEALRNPGSVETLPRAPGDPLPVALWLYPAPLQAVATEEPGEDPTTGEEGGAAVQQGQRRKQAERIDDRKETDGLLVFKLEALFSWAEQVELDRPQEEDLEQDLASAAEDLDIISLSRQRRAGSAGIKFDLDLPAPQHDDLPLGDGIRLPEWDYRHERYLENYCLLQPMLADDALPAPLPAELRRDALRLRREFAWLRPEKQWQRRQPMGEELDLDAWIDLRTRPQKSLEQPAVFRHLERGQRDLSCLLLADLSLSTEAAVATDLRVIDLVRDSLLLFAEALDSAGDPFAIYGFSSIRNKQVRYQLLKNFAEPYTDATRGRIAAIRPGFYTRMGAAIRQSTEVLKMQKSARRLLLILSDGKPNDLDRYEGRYGIEDTRKAIQEARSAGLTPFCVTIDAGGNDYLPYLFGDGGYAVISDLCRLPTLLPRLYLQLAPN